MPGVIKTIVGGGRPTFTAGGNALESILEGASGVAADAYGNRYIAGFLSNRVFKIDAGGRVTVFAGTGTATTSGDGGSATDAGIYAPSAVAVDGSTIYVVEQLGNRIRRVDEKGVITTIAGGGAKETAGREDLSATEVHLDVPNGIAVRGGEIFFTEFGGNRIRKIDRDGALTTIAGTGNAATSGDGGPATKAAVHGPTGIVVDAEGTVYVSEMFGGRIRRVSPKGSITTFAGSGPRGQDFDGKRATEAKLRAPNGLALDAQGQLYVADFADNRIYTVNTKSGIIKTLAGTRRAPAAGNIGMARSGPAKQVPVESPLGLAVDPSGRLLVALYNQGAVLSVESQGGALTANSSPIIRHVAGEFAPALTVGTEPTDLYLKNAGSVSADGLGNIYVADVFANRIIKVSADDTRATTIVGPTSSGDGATNDILDVHHPVGVVPISNGLVIMEAHGNRVSFLNNENNAVQRMSMDEMTDHPHFGDEFGFYTYMPAAGGSTTPAAGTVGAELLRAAGKKVAPKTTAPGKRAIEPFFVYADTGNNRVRIINQSGVVATLAGTGKAVSSGDGKRAAEANLQHPQDAAVDSDGNVYISEAYRVRKVDMQTGIITTIVGNGTSGFSGIGGPATQASITSAYGLAIDGRDLYIADPWAGRVYKVDERGTITVFAGTGERNSSGDGGPPTSAGLNAPVDVAIRRKSDGSVHLLIAELEGGRVRSVRLR